VRYIPIAILDTETVPLTLDEAYLEKLGLRLSAYDAAIQRWSAQVEAASADERLQRDMESLRRKQATVRERLAHLHNASAGAWHELKTRLEAAWSDFSQALEQAMLRFGM
jgi:flagellar motility protein MotE (MotC chaperone)